MYYIELLKILMKYTSFPEQCLFFLRDNVNAAREQCALSEKEGFERALLSAHSLTLGMASIR